MGRKRILNKHKNKPISVSLTPEQIAYITTHPDFSVSKFVQMVLDDHVISLQKEINKLKRRENNDEKTIN